MLLCVCMLPHIYFLNQLNDFYEIWYGCDQGRNLGGGSGAAAALRGKMNIINENILFYELNKFQIIEPNKLKFNS